MAKGLRLASICEPGLHKLDLHVIESVDIEKYITSYRLKNSLFYLLKKNQGLQGENSNGQMQFTPKYKSHWKTTGVFHCGMTINSIF